MDVVLAALQLLIGQPRVLATEYQCDFAAPGRLLHGNRRALPRIEQRPGNAPITSAGSEHQTATSQRLFQRCNDPCTIENVGCTGRPGHSVGTREILGIDQYQARKPHVLHGASRTTDVAGMTGIDQHDTNVLQRHNNSLLESEQKAYRKRLPIRHLPPPATTTVTLHAPALS